MIHLITAPGPGGAPAAAREGLAAYRSRGGYDGLRRAIQHGSGWVLSELERAGLRGRGGSGRGLPVAAKWAKVARAHSAQRYVIGNGAEGSPVSRKDRYLLEFFPHRVLEGLLIAAVATGADTAYLYIRGDAEAAVAGARKAMDEAREAGLFGPGTDLPVEVHLQTAAAGYITGEETAVIDALEGLEGLPQPKPPHPEETGLKGLPTAVSNVETLAAAAAILREGVEGFRAHGTRDCPGTALFTVGGAVERPGVYEVPYGTPLAELLRMAGAPPREDLLAVLPGGLSSGPLRPDELEVPLTYEDLAAVGSTMGNAAVVVLSNAEATLPRALAETVAFLADASCGQCLGCKETHKALAEALAVGDPGRARDVATMMLYGRGNCAHPSGTARLALRALQSFPEAWR